MIIVNCRRFPVQISTVFPPFHRPDRQQPEQSAIAFGHCFRGVNNRANHLPRASRHAGRRAGRA